MGGVVDLLKILDQWIKDLTLNRGSTDQEHIQYTSILIFESSLVSHWLKGMIAGRMLSPSTTAGNLTTAAVAIYKKKKQYSLAHAISLKHFLLVGIHIVDLTTSVVATCIKMQFCHMHTNGLYMLHFIKLAK